MSVTLGVPGGPLGQLANDHWSAGTMVVGGQVVVGAVRHGELGLERGVCSALMGALGGDKADSARAMERADRNGYGGLHLRALFFLSDDQMEEGQITAGSKSASLGLETYWSGVFPPTRGYSFYTAQSYGAQIAHRRSGVFARLGFRSKPTVPT